MALTAPDSPIIASAGQVVASEAGRAGEQRRHWLMPHVTSFALAASPEFVETRRSAEGLEIRLFQLRGDTRFDAIMADYAADAARFYIKLFGFYPHPAFVMLPGTYHNGGGYSPASGFAQFYKNSGEDNLRWIVAHEMAHQYWGFDTVIDDGEYDHWPGLPLGIYTDLRYCNSRIQWGFNTAQYRESLAKGWDTTIRRTREATKSAHFDWGQVVSHEKGWTVMRMLEDLMGAPQFLGFVQSLQEQYRYRYLSFDDFQSAAERAAGRDLKWFFHDWVNTNGIAAYAIEAVEEVGDGVSVRIRRTGSARFPVEVRMTTATGGDTVKRIAPELEVQTLIFPAGRPKLVEIEPRGRCPLLKNGREVWQRPSE